MYSDDWESTHPMDNLLSHEATGEDLQSSEVTQMTLVQ